MEAASTATRVTVPDNAPITLENTSKPPMGSNRHRVLLYLARGIPIEPLHVTYLLSEACQDVDVVCDAIDGLAPMQGTIGAGDFKAAIAVSEDGGG